MNTTATLSPESNHGLDIQEVVGGMIDNSASAERVDSLFAEIVETIDREDLQVDKVAELANERDQLLAPFKIDPRHSVIAETALLAALSERRTVTGHQSLQRVAMFATRSAAEDGIDTLYRTITNPDGSQFVTIASRLQGQLEEPCYISTANGKLSITDRIWRRGTWEYVEREIAPGSRGEKLYEAFIGSSMWAGHLAVERGDSERQAADAHALKLLQVDQGVLRGGLTVQYTA